MSLAKLLVMFPVCLGALAAQTITPPSPDKTPPSYDLKPQALQDLQVLQQHFASLAAVLPEDLYKWRPTEGVRSFSEVFLHVALMNYSFAPYFGVPAAPGFEIKDYEKSTTDKSKIIAEINKSFDYVRAAIDKRSNKELQTIVPKFGPDASEGDLAFLVVSDDHEHMGQAVAYARMKGIILPWTAAAQKANPK